MKTFYLFYLVFPLVCFNHIAKGQNNYSDSLKIALQNSTSVDEEIKTLFQLVEEFLYIDTKVCTDYIDSIITLAQKNNLSKEEASAYLWKGRVYIIDYNYDLSLANLQKADEMFSEQKDSFYLAKVYNGLGILKKYNSEYEEAIKYQFKAAGILEKIAKPIDVGAIYNSIGSLYIALQDMENAKKYLNTAIQYLEDDPRTQLGAMINLAGILDDDKVVKMELLTKCYAQSIKNELHRYSATIASMLAEYYEKIELNQDSMKAYYLKAIQYGKLANDSYTVATNQMYLAVLDAKKDPKSSESIIHSALKDPVLIGDDMILTYGYKELSNLQAKTNNFNAAYSNLDSSFHYYKKIYNDGLSEQAALANARYETEKKDAKLARQELEITKKENQRKTILSISLLSLLFLASLYLWYYQKQKIRRKEVDIALLERQKEAEKMKEIDEMKNQFFTNVSHELRTPLTLILGPLSDVMEKTTDPQTQKSVYLAYHNAERLLEMVNEVLDLSKIESGHVQLVKNDVSLPSFIRRVLFAFESMAQMRNITLHVNEIPNISVSVDADKLEKILNNIISNAIKYSENGSKIDLFVSKKDNDYSFHVTDYGKGIHPSETDKIFNRFYQSNVVTAVEGGGTGVGLALSRELAELLGGHLTVKSTLGEGSTFTLELPMAESTIEVETEAFSEPIRETANYRPILINGVKPHILVIEDNPEMSAYIGSILDEDYRCTFVKDGYAALQKVQTDGFDLISSDIMMPNMDGFQLKQKLNQIKGMNSTPFIFLTARTLEEDVLAGLRLGVDDYITKPFNKYEYKARIQNLLKNKVDRDESLSLEGNSLGMQTNIEEELLKAAEKSVLKHLSEPEYKVSDLALEMNYSQRQLTRIVNNLTGMAPVNFILELRLQRAYHLLKTKSFHTVSEVMFEVGIGSASYFARKFKERFGISPGDVK